MNKIAEFTDYTSQKTNPGGCQNTMDKDGRKVAKDFNFNEALKKYGDPKAAADAYLKWCAVNQYTAKFAEFAGEENYYKLLEDFTLYDKDGNYVPQREVRAVFPKKTDAFGSTRDLIESGLQEDAIVEGKRDKNLSSIVDEIQKTLPKTDAEIEESQVAQAGRDVEAQYSLRGDNDQYDVSGVHWGFKHGIISKAEAGIVWEAIANITKRRYSYPRTINGEDIISSDNAFFFVEVDYRYSCINKVYGLERITK